MKIDAKELQMVSSLRLDRCPPIERETTKEFLILLPIYAFSLPLIYTIRMLQMWIVEEEGRKFYFVQLNP